MSQWTQISGNVRIDGFVGFNGRTDAQIEDEIQKSLGKAIHYDSPREDWDLPKDKRTPTGSEGGIEYKYFITAHDDGSTCRGAVVFTGSLRDYGEEEYGEILEWLNKTFANVENDYKKSFFVRQGVVEVRIEGIKTVFLVWDDKKRLFVEERSAHN